MEFIPNVFAVISKRIGIEVALLKEALGPLLQTARIPEFLRFELAAVPLSEDSIERDQIVARIEFLRPGMSAVDFRPDGFGVLFPFDPDRGLKVSVHVTQSPWG